MLHQFRPHHKYLFYFLFSPCSFLVESFGFVHFNLQRTCKYDVESDDYAAEDFHSAKCLAQCYHINSQEEINIKNYKTKKRKFDLDSIFNEHLKMATTFALMI